MFINGPIFLGIGQFFKYYFFFLGGYLFYRYQKQLSFIYLKRNATVLISLYALVCIICGIRYITQPELSYLNIIHVDHIIELSRMILRILMILIAFIIVDYYLKNKNTISHIFDSLNKLSYGIYLFHMLYLQIIHTYIFDYTIPIAENFGFISPIILFIIILSLSIYSTYIIRKSKWGIYLIG